MKTLSLSQPSYRDETIVMLHHHSSLWIDRMTKWAKNDNYGTVRSKYLASKEYAAHKEQVLAMLEQARMKGVYE